MKFYNGCPDSKTQTFLDRNIQMLDALKGLGYTVTYFPEGEFYQAFNTRHLVASREHGTIAEVFDELVGG